MAAGAASRYALGADGAGAARPAPAASLISASRCTRSALGAQRCAPRALRACVRSGAAAGCHRRLALRARRRGRGRCAPGRLRQPFRRLALRARRRRRGRYAPGRVHLLSPRCMRTLPLGGGDVEDVVRFALLETLGARRASRSCRGRGWGGVVQTSSCASVRGTLVCCRSMCSARRRGAPLGSERLPPRPGRSPALSARVLQRFALERCGQVGAARRRHSRVTAK